ncbi:acyltransferase family protein [uncultured Pantoea sp.]|uniref:acyltransferase family protein n=1 Tax=uncultured Pantoea sp. TaxID=218084 RepID=UPI0025D96EC1|nr:acyltransferase family protein [uncultured Pantoea sp.]
MILVGAAVQYRRELDGLRALAVISVIVYHAKLKILGVNVLSGGFLGVDVFFVLSGFLITGIIKNGLDNKNFSFLTFYWRRVKRIVPALLIVLVFTSIFAYKILLPNDLVIYAQSLKSALYFGSNFYFFSEDSYTAASSVLKPLLHTWSLGVEWQFYMIFPILFAFVYKVAKNKTASILIFIAIVSILIAEFTVTKHANFAFYLLPARAWELLLGGSCVYVAERVTTNFKKNNGLAMSMLPKIGIALIVFSFILINDGYHLPSFLSLMPVIGTCFIIVFSNADETTNKLLSIKPIVFIGAISYSLYLWHQPIFAFYRLSHSEVLSHIEVILLIGLSIVLAIVTYHLVENPSRRAKGKKSIVVMASLIIMLFSTGNSFIVSGGYPQRLKGLSSIYDNGPSLPSMSECGNVIGKHCIVHDERNEKFIILIGDSHAQAMAPSLYDLARDEGYNFANFSMASCPVIDTITKRLNDGYDSACNKLADDAWKFIKDHKKSLIVYMTRMPLYMLNNKYGTGQWLFSDTEGSIKDDMRNSITQWAVNDNKVILVYPVPQPPYHVPNETNKSLINAKTVDEKLGIFNQKGFLNFDKTKYQSVWDVNFKESRSLFDSIGGNKIIRIYPERVLCDGDICKTHDWNHLYYKDDNHLNYYGMNLVVSQIRERLTEIAP